MLRVGLLGAGRIGRLHAVNISGDEHSELVAVSDFDSTTAKDLASKHGAAARTNEEILTDPQIDAVLVASPTNTHADLIEAAVANGKAVYCEKPIDLDLARARRCQAAVAQSSVPVMIGFNRRFDPQFSRLKAELDAGSIGKSELLSLTSFDPSPPPISYVKVSGGLFRDMAIHDFDMACWLMGGAPVSVSATGGCVVDPEIGEAGDVDTAVTTLQFEGGAIAVIKNSRRAVYGYDQRIELLGAEGLLAADNVKENTIRKLTEQAEFGAKPRYFFLERYMDSYTGAWAGFVNAVRDGGKPPITLQDGVTALAIAEIATRSAQSGEVLPFSQEID
ncbi:MAG: inositol 2-dehydrogenase [Neomegalonema sp.]|nr:inositol 2-dehydrogenase [Neomegalonema sp.]